MGELLAEGVRDGHYRGRRLREPTGREVAFVAWAGMGSDADVRAGKIVDARVHRGDLGLVQRPARGT